MDRNEKGSGQHRKIFKDQQVQVEAMEKMVQMERVQVHQILIA
jgi:hypothetical protein